MLRGLHKLQCIFLVGWGGGDKVCVRMSEAICFTLHTLCLQQIKAVTESGVNVIVTGGKIGDLAQHYCNKFKVMVIRLLSKWDVRRLCKSIGATALPKIVSE